MKHVNKHLIFMLLAAMLFGTILTACGGEDPTPTPRPSNNDNEDNTPPEEDPTEEPEPTAEPTATPEPTETPDPTAGFVDFSNDVLGVSLSYPGDWAIEFDEEAGDMKLASSQEILDDGEDKIKGAILNVLFLDTELLGFFGGDGVDTTDPVAVLGIFSDLISENGGDGSFDMVITDEPTAVTINGQSGATALAMATSKEGDEAIVKLSVILSGNRAAFVFAGAENSAEAEMRPALDAIENSITLSTPVGAPPTTGGVEIPESVGFLLYGDVVDGTVDESGPSAWSFGGLEGEAVDIIVVPADGFDAVVDIVDENGNSVLPTGEVDDSFDTEELLGFVIPTTGNYTILVRGFAGATGDYQLTLAEAGTAVAPPPTTGEAGGAIAIGEAVAGTSDTSDPSVWIFAGQEGDVVDIIVVPEGDFDAVVDVVDSSGNSILPNGEVDASFGTEEVLGVVIPASGSYAIMVRGFAGDTGNYQLTLTEAGTAVSPPPIAGGDGTPIAYGDFASGSVDASNPVASFSFAGVADDVVGMIITPSGDFDAIIDVVDAAGNSLLSRERDASFGNENVIVSLPSDGVYTINVFGFDGAAGSFDLQMGFPLTNVVIAAPDTLDPEDEGEGHSFPFTALRAGDMVGIYAEPAENLDIAIQVRQGGDLLSDLGFDPERGFDSSVAEEEFVMIASETGTYTFRVLNSQDEEFAGNTGDYEVVLFGTPEVVFELTYGDFVDARTNPDGLIDYVISGQPGDSVVLNVISDDDSVDMIIEILDLDENVLASIDEGFSGEPEELTYTFESEELVIIRVRDFFGGEGDFVMSVEAGG